MAKEKNKDNVLLWHSFIDVMLDLTDEETKEVLQAFKAYIKGEPTSFTERGAEVAWKGISLQLDADKKKWEETCERNQRNGRNGGRPKKPSDAEENPKNPVGFFASENRKQNPTQPKKADTDTDTDIYKENSIKENSKPKQKFVPPTVDEVKAYAAEMGYVDFNAIKFHAHYESNGWMVNKNKMKNWKASVRYWANNDYGNGGNYGNAKRTSSRNEGTFNELSNGYEKFDE